MIGYVKGNVIWSADGVVLLECGGIGYEIICSTAVYQKLVSAKSGEVYTYLAVREDGISLYGFESIEEKQHKRIKQVLKHFFVATIHLLHFVLNHKAKRISV